MNKCVKDFAKTMIDSVEEGTNPVIATSVFTGYLQALEDLEQITPIELVDVYYDFSIKIARTAFPDVSTDKEASGSTWQMEEKHTGYYFRND